MSSVNWMNTRATLKHVRSSCSPTDIFYERSPAARYVQLCQSWERTEHPSRQRRQVVGGHVPMGSSGGWERSERGDKGASVTRLWYCILVTSGLLVWEPQSPTVKMQWGIHATTCDIVQPICFQTYCLEHMHCVDFQTLSLCG